jgi:electron transfer flavoprotein beta subunit
MPAMDVLVYVKRIPAVGGRIVLTEDARHVDTTMLGFTVSPHEECAVEEAVRITEAHGGSVTVSTLGPPEAAEQLRAAVAVGAHHAHLLETTEDNWGPIATARALADSVRSLEAGRGRPYDLVLCGNEAADSADYQVGVRLAHALGRPCATGIKRLDVCGGVVEARREYRGTEELFTLALPAVVTVKEGINLPRYPSLPGRMRAKKAEVTVAIPELEPDELEMQRLRVPRVERRSAEVLGRGVDAVPALVALLEEIGAVP